MNRELRVGTRGSLLARCQAELTIARLRQYADGFSVSIHVISTKGDLRQDHPLHELASTGVFVKEIEQALLSGQIDLAVHSLKDMPSELSEGLCIAGVLKRSDPRDALVSRSGGVDQLPSGAVVGTSSLRRRSQLLHRRPDLQVHDVRGNVKTRLSKLDDGGYDALVMASCGLDRLGLAGRISERIDPQLMLPAPCQGIIAIETRANDAEVIELVRGFSDNKAMLCAETERAFLLAVGGGCQVPIGCLSVEDGREVRVDGMIASVDGRAVVRGQGDGNVDTRVQVARALAAELLAKGGAKILQETAG